MITRGSVGTAAVSISPLHDPSRGRRLVKILSWLAAIVGALALLHLLGVDVMGWLRDLWERVSVMPLGYLVTGIALQVAETTLNGVAYYAIFKYAYPDACVTLWPIVTAYAVGVALNSFVLANLGTLVTLVMFVALIPGSSFTGVFAAYLVNKIFFVVVGGLIWVLLFLQAGAAFDIEFGWFRQHPLLFLITVVGGTALLALLTRMAWRWLKGLWAKAKQGGRILASPRAYATRVLAPQVLSYAAHVAMIAIFLSAYSIPVTGRSVVGVLGSSSAANITSVTPGAVGVTQAANSVALRDYTDSDNATAYSISQQLVASATNVLYGLVLMVLVLGWTGGRALVHESYAGAKEQARERRSGRRRTRAQAADPPDDSGENSAQTANAPGAASGDSGRGEAARR